MGGQALKLPFENTATWRDELVRFSALAILGAAASYLSVNIPYTKVFIEGRWIFGFMGFALLHHWWMAFLLACFLSVTRIYALSPLTILIGNMLYAFPILLVIRFFHTRFLDRVRGLIGYGILWLLMIMLCYQAFTTPVLWGYLAFLDDNPIWPAIFEGWREQPFLVESLLVGVISGLGMMVVRSNAALRASQRELATTLYSIGDGVIATDVDGQVRRMNPVAEKLTGWREVEAQGQPLAAVFHILNEETHQPVESPVAQVLQEGHVVSLANHTLLLARDGTERPIVDSAAPIRGENGRVTGVVLVFRDQTEKRAVQKKLEESHARLLLALRNARMGIWDRDVHTNQVAWLGEHASLFGIPIEDFGGTIDDVQNCVHPDDREQGMGVFRRTIETGADFDNVYRVVWPDGRVRWMHSYGKLARDEEGEPQRIVGTTQDVTEQVQAEERMKAALAEKETLLRELYHRTKNNMQVIRSMLVLQAGQSAHPDVQRLVQGTEQRIYAMALVHQKLYQAQDLSRIDMRDYLTDLAQWLMQSCRGTGDNVKLALDLQDISVMIDTAIPCSLVVNELVSNALKHAFPGGRRGEIRVRLFRADEGEIALHVSDDGVGVPPDFDFSAQSTLGMQIVRSLVEHQLEGSVQFDVQDGVTGRVRFADRAHTPRV